MTEIMSNSGALIVLAFVVNVIVQMTKGIIPIPTKLWCIIVSAVVMTGALYVTTSQSEIDVKKCICALAGSFVVAYVAMYGFDTLKELWERFKKGEGINGNNK